MFLIVTFGYYEQKGQMYIFVYKNIWSLLEPGKKGSVYEREK